MDVLSFFFFKKELKNVRPFKKGLLFIGSVSAHTGFFGLSGHWLEMASPFS